MAQCLTQWGYEVERGLGGTGVVGQLRRAGGKRLGLRADMDALPIQEATGLEHTANEGIMHACGRPHAMLLAAAHHLARHGEFDGTLNLIFQPAEEGLGGAMMEDGLFSKYPCDAIFAMHNMPGHPQGHLLLRRRGHGVLGQRHHHAGRRGRARAMPHAPPIRWSPARPSSWACKASWPATSIRCTCR